MFAAKGIMQPTSFIRALFDVYAFIMFILFRCVVQKWIFIFVFNYIILFLKSLFLLCLKFGTGITCSLKQQLILFRFSSSQAFLIKFIIVTFYA